MEAVIAVGFRYCLRGMVKEIAETTGVMPSVSLMTDKAFLHYSAFITEKLGRMPSTKKIMLQSRLGKGCERNTSVNAVTTNNTDFSGSRSILTIWSAWSRCPQPFIKKIRTEKSRVRR